MEKMAAAVRELLRETMDGVFAEITRLIQEERSRFDSEHRQRFYQDREDFEKRVLAVVMTNFERKVKTFRAANTRCFVVGKVELKEHQKGFHWRTVEHTYQDAKRAMQPGERVRAGQILIDRYTRIMGVRASKRKPQQANI